MNNWGGQCQLANGGGNLMYIGCSAAGHHDFSLPYQPLWGKLYYIVFLEAEESEDSTKDHIIGKFNFFWHSATHGALSSKPPFQNFFRFKDFATPCKAQ